MNDPEIKHGFDVSRMLVKDGFEDFPGSEKAAISKSTPCQLILYGDTLLEASRRVRDFLLFGAVVENKLIVDLKLCYEPAFFSGELQFLVKQTLNVCHEGALLPAELAYFCHHGIFRAFSMFLYAELPGDDVPQHLHFFSGPGPCFAALKIILQLHSNGTESVLHCLKPAFLGCIFPLEINETPFGLGEITLSFDELVLGDIIVRMKGLESIPGCFKASAQIHILLDQYLDPLTLIQLEEG